MSLFNATEVMSVILVNDTKANEYDYVSRKDGRRKQGVAIALPCMVEDKETGRFSFLIVNISAVDPSLEFKKGEYTLTVPASYLKKTFVGGVNIHEVGFNTSRSECSFVKSKK